MEECGNFIKTMREARHIKTMERQRRKMGDCAIKTVSVRVATQTSSMAAIK